MTRFVQVVCILLGIPTVIFFCLMGFPVIMFGLGGGIFGNPLNLLFVLWWAVGGFGLYCGLMAVLAMGRGPCQLTGIQQIGITLGLLSFLPLVPLSLTGEIGWGTRAAPLALIPGILLLACSFLSKRKMRDSDNQSQQSHGADGDNGAL